MSEPDEATVTIRLLFADEGAFYEEEIKVPGQAVDRYERLIDFLQEDEALLRKVYVDLDRLCSARLVESPDPREGPGA